MFWNNVKIALRNLRKNKVFAVINISGLAIGMTIFIFGGLLVDYERTHDAFFVNSENTYTVGSHAAPELDAGFDQLNAAFSAVGPIIEAEFPDVEAVARTIRREFLASFGAESFYQSVTFADPAFLKIFDLGYVHGDASALDNPTSIIITEPVAIKYFGSTDVVGKTVTLDHEFEFQIGAVITAIPMNSHFNSLPIMQTTLEVIAPLAALNRMRDYDLAGDWDNLSLGNMTYIMLPESLDGEWLQNQLNGIYDRIEFKYNRQGEVTEIKDQNETVHAYDFDALDRQTQDRVTTLGEGAHGTSGTIGIVDRLLLMFARRIPSESLIA